MAAPAGRVLNINVGVLGHVDCGKTSLVAALSTTLSTAALDKHPQSKERGITLDLGFSAFTVAPPPPELARLGAGELQFTLVDCPGHASLIRTVITGAQIIDAVILVIDVTKGFQAQTAECLVVAEIAASDLVVALNKTDLLPEESRPKAVRRAARLVRETLAATKFAGAAVVPVCAKRGEPPSGMQELRDWLVGCAVRQRAEAPAAAEAEGGAPFLFAVDHCFQLKGQGTVLTGTVLQGRCSVNDTVELPALKLSRQVRSIQVFRRPVASAAAGDRAALCVTQLSAKLMERGLAAAPGSVPTFGAAVAAAHKVRFFPGRVPGRAKYHVSVGQSTVMAEAEFFGAPDAPGTSQADALRLMTESLSLRAAGGGGAAAGSQRAAFDWRLEYLHQPELYGLEGRPAQALGGAGGGAGSGGGGGGGGAAARAGAGGEWDRHFGAQWVLLRFEQPVTAPEGAVVIGARFDVDAAGESCRLAFHGRLLASLGPGSADDLRRLRVYKVKERQGVLSRIAPDGASAIAQGLFKKETDISVFEGAAVVTGRGEAGRVAGRFGTGGKVRLEFELPGLLLTPPPAEGQQQQQRGAADNAVFLRYKRFVHDQDGGGRRVQQ